MAFNDLEDKREYQRKWRKNRRKKWIKRKGPCAICLSKDNLVIHHIDPEIKDDKFSWTWSNNNIAEELNKCIVLCKQCHISVHRARGDFVSTPDNAQLREEEVRCVKTLLRGTELSQRQIASKLDIKRHLIADISAERTYVNV